MVSKLSISYGILYKLNTCIAIRTLLKKEQLNYITEFLCLFLKENTCGAKPLIYDKNNYGYMGKIKKKITEPS